MFPLPNRGIGIDPAKSASALVVGISRLGFPSVGKARQSIGIIEAQGRRRFGDLGFAGREGGREAERERESGELTDTVEQEAFWWAVQDFETKEQAGRYEAKKPGTF